MKSFQRDSNSDIISEFFTNLFYELLLQSVIFIVSIVVISYAISLLGRFFHKHVKRVISDITSFFNRSKKPVVDDMGDSYVEDPHEYETDSSEYEDDVDYDESSEDIEDSSEYHSDLSFLFNPDAVIDVKDNKNGDHVGYQSEFEWNDVTDHSNIKISHKQYCDDRHWDHLYENNVDYDEITRDI